MHVHLESHFFCEKSQNSSLIVNESLYRNFKFTPRETGSITFRVITLYANSKRCRRDINQPRVQTQGNKALPIRYSPPWGGGRGVGRIQLNEYTHSIRYRAGKHHQQRTMHVGCPKAARRLPVGCPKARPIQTPFRQGVTTSIPHLYRPNIIS